MTSKTVIYRYLKKQGVPYAEAYRMASELSVLIDNNAQVSQPPAESKN